MQKIIVIGCPGSGKSSFSRRLRALTGLPLFHLDQMNWNADRTTVPRAVFRERLELALRQSAWIIDGNYGSTLEQRLLACDTVFFLDYPLELCLEGIRQRRGKQRSDLPCIEPEDEEDAAFLSFIRAYGQESRPRVLELLEQHPTKEIHIFTGREEADSFLETLRPAEQSPENCIPCIGGRRGGSDCRRVTLPVCAAPSPYWPAVKKTRAVAGARGKTVPFPGLSF